MRVRTCVRLLCASNFNVQVTTVLPPTSTGRKQCRSVWSMQQLATVSSFTAGTLALRGLTKCTCTEPCHPWHLEPRSLCYTIRIPRFGIYADVCTIPATRALLKVTPGHLSRQLRVLGGAGASHFVLPCRSWRSFRHLFGHGQFHDLGVAWRACTVLLIHNGTYSWNLEDPDAVSSDLPGGAHQSRPSFPGAVHCAFRCAITCH